MDQYKFYYMFGSTTNFLDSVFSPKKAFIYKIGEDTCADIVDYSDTIEFISDPQFMDVVSKSSFYTFMAYVTTVVEEQPDY